MKKAKPKDFYVNRAASDFRDLVEYFTCIRPRHQKVFQDEKGAFQVKKLENALDFVSEFRHQPKAYKIKNAKRYRFFQKVLNDTFCIPTPLIKKVLGVWGDEAGNQHRITLAEIAPLVSNFCERWTLHGHTFAKKGDKPSQTFCNKWRICNKKQWYRLISLDRDIFKENSRIARTIRKFIKNERKTAETKDFSATKNAGIEKEIGEMKVMAIQDAGIPDEDPPWVTATSPQTITAKPQKEELHIKTVSPAPDPARKARLVRTIERLANEGSITRSNYRTMISTFFGVEPNLTIGRKMEDTLQTLANARSIYKKVLDNIAIYQIPSSRLELINSRLNLVSAWLVEKHKDEQTKIHN